MGYGRFDSLLNCLSKDAYYEREFPFPSSINFKKIYLWTRGNYQNSNNNKTYKINKLLVLNLNNNTVEILTSQAQGATRWIDFIKKLE